MNYQLIYILVIAAVAAIILFRLYMVLGRRTGHERPPHSRFERIGGDAIKQPEKPVLLPGPEARSENPEAAPDPVSRGLLDIGLADRAFEKDHFLEGAHRAYETIVAAFAQGDRAALRPLLSDDVYAAFEKAIGEREAKKEKVEFTFVGFRDVKIASASLDGNMAEITLSIAAQFISATKNATGAIIDGDPRTVRDATDIWSFERNVRASDLNWKVAATSGEAGLQA